MDHDDAGGGTTAVQPVIYDAELRAFFGGCGVDPPWIVSPFGGWMSGEGSNHVEVCGR